MALLEEWRAVAYSKEMDRAALQKFWGTYFQIEKNIYEKLLTNPDEEVKGTVKELAEKYEIDVFTMTGFLDGINESLKEENPIETMEEDTVVNLIFDKEKLYKNMVEFFFQKSIQYTLFRRQGHHKYSLPHQVPRENRNSLQ